MEIIANDQCNHITLSWVTCTEAGRLLGEAANNQHAANPLRTIFDIKRLIGRKYDDKELQRDMKLLPYKIVNKEGKPYVQVALKDGETKVFSPEEISAMILTKMKETTEAFLGKKVKDVVIIVPGYQGCWCDCWIKCSKNHHEPTAITIAYGLDKRNGDKNILVFDLGGGTLNACILTIDNGVFEVLSINGDTHLGSMIVTWLSISVCVYWATV